MQYLDDFLNALSRDEYQLSVATSSLEDVLEKFFCKFNRLYQHSLNDLKLELIFHNEKGRFIFTAIRHFGKDGVYLIKEDKITGKVITAYWDEITPDDLKEALINRISDIRSEKLKSIKVLDDQLILFKALLKGE